MRHDKKPWSSSHATPIYTGSRSEKANRNAMSTAGRSRPPQQDTDTVSGPILSAFVIPDVLGSRPSFEPFDERVGRELSTTSAPAVPQKRTALTIGSELDYENVCWMEKTAFNVNRRESEKRKMQTKRSAFISRK